MLASAMRPNRMIETKEKDADETEAWKIPFQSPQLIQFTTRSLFSYLKHQARTIFIFLSTGGVLKLRT